MCDTTVRPISNQRQEQVIWPDPSPLASWWDSVMGAEHISTPQFQRSVS
ncbi:hypothetical protein [Nocardia sp. NPDC004123]